MRNALSLLFFSAVTIPMLNGCGNRSMAIGTCSGGACLAIITPVSISMTDSPPSGVSVLFYQIKLSAAALNPVSGTPVSLLPVDSGPNGSSMPIPIDLTQLQAVSQFLSTVNVAPGVYSSLSLTFSNPLLVIYNASDSAIASSCAIGSVCQIAPTMNNSATVNLNAPAFPVSATAYNPLSFLVDFHLDNMLQPDFSLNLGTANGVTIAQIPASTTATAQEFGTITGSVFNSNSGSNQFTIETPDIRLYTIDSSNGAAYNNFPASACSTGSTACFAYGQSIRVQVDSLGTFGNLYTSQVAYIQAPNEQTVEGTIINMVPSPTNIAGAPPLQLSLLIHGNPSNSSSLPPGAVATVTFATYPSFSVDTNGFQLPAGITFANGSDLIVGQNVQMKIVAGSLSVLSGQPPSSNWSTPQSVSFAADSIELEPSQLTATVSALNPSAQSFTLSGSSGVTFFSWPSASPNAASFNILTTAQTTYQGASPDTMGGFALNDLVSVSGWLFPPATYASLPTLVAASALKRPLGVF